MAEEIEDGSGRLTDEEQRYRGLVENAFDIIVECAASGRVLYVAPNVEDVLGLEPSEIVGTFVNDLVHPDDVRKGIESFSNAVTRGERIQSALRYRHKDGTWRTIEGRGKAYASASGKLRVVIIGRDITERVHADQALRRLLRRIQLQVEQTPVAIIVWNLERLITEWNPAAQRLFGYPKSSAIGRPASLIVPKGAPHGDPLIEEAQSVLASALVPVRFSSENVTKEGERIRCEWIVAPLVDEGSRITAYLGIAEGEGERTTIRRLEDLAYRDSVTGMANRRLFDDRLAALIDSRRRRFDSFAILYIDVDDFKAVNDRYGHAIGDKVLAAIGLRLQVCVRDTDIVARIGGDEFGVIVTQLESSSYAEEVAARIVESLRKPLDAGAMSFDVRASIGVARFPSDGIDAAALMKRADEAMYRAKQKGTSTFSL